MALSPNYSWSEPDNSSLVKNGAADIRTLGDAIDTSLWNVGFGQAGKNKIINGAFNIWQRGTSFSNPASPDFSADRWQFNYDGSGATRTVSRQAFTAGAAPVAGYENQYFLRINESVVGTTESFVTLFQRIEDARTFAGQTVTVSFWAKTDSTRTTYRGSGFTQNFGSGGSPSGAVTTSDSPTFTFTTSWQRYSFTMDIPSVSGKTFGTDNNSFLQLTLRLFLNTTFTFDIWGVQVEYGSKATPFQTATGTLQGELAAASRYYQRQLLGSARYGLGFSSSTTAGKAIISLPVAMRVAPTSMEYGGTIIWYDGVGGAGAGTLTLENPSTVTAGIGITGSSGLTQYRPIGIGGNSADAYLAFSAEL